MNILLEKDTSLLEVSRIPLLDRCMRMSATCSSLHVHFTTLQDLHYIVLTIVEGLTIITKIDYDKIILRIRVITHNNTKLHVILSCDATPYGLGVTFVHTFHNIILFTYTFNFWKALCWIRTLRTSYCLWSEVFSYMCVKKYVF